MLCYLFFASDWMKFALLAWFLKAKKFSAFSQVYAVWRTFQEVVRFEKGQWFQQN